LDFLRYKNRAIVKKWAVFVVSFSSLNSSLFTLDSSYLKSFHFTRVTIKLSESSWLII